MSTADEAWRKFLRAVREGALFAKGDTVVAGVSGGPDSLAMLHMLCRLNTEESWGLRLIAAHLNHGIRPEAGEDARFIEELAREWGLECEIGFADVPAMARQPGMSLEEAARIARYRFLGEVAGRHGAPVIAVAHHADDQVESVLMHFLRGSGLAGLRGMRPAVPLREMRLGAEAVGGDARVVRPLLECWRAEIEEYCRHYGLTPRFDRSNLDTTFFRNRLRHELIPYLETYNPQIRQVLLRTAHILAQDYDFLHTHTLQVWDTIASSPEPGVIALERSAWSALHPSVQAGLLREAIHRLRWGLRNINWIHVHNALEVARRGEAGARATLPQGLMLTVGYRYIWVADEGWRPAEGLYPQMDAEQIPLAVPGRARISGEWVVETEVVEGLPAGEGARPPDIWTAYMDADKVDVASLCLRRRRPRDRLCPMGMGGRAKEVRALFIDEKVPLRWRPAYPLAADSAGVLWVPGLRLDERAAVTPSTRRVLVVRLRHISASEERDERETGDSQA
jgi:tRNA(Ile)-lysidine synthase